MHFTFVSVIAMTNHNRFIDTLRAPCPLPAYRRQVPGTATSRKVWTTTYDSIDIAGNFKTVREFESTFPLDGADEVRLKSPYSALNLYTMPIETEGEVTHYWSMQVQPVLEALFQGIAEFRSLVGPPLSSVDPSKILDAFFQMRHSGVPILGIEFKRPPLIIADE